MRGEGQSGARMKIAYNPYNTPYQQGWLQGYADGKEDTVRDASRRYRWEIEEEIYNLVRGWEEENHAEYGGRPPYFSKSLNALAKLAGWGEEEGVENVIKEVKRRRY